MKKIFLLLFCLFITSLAFGEWIEVDEESTCFYSYYYNGMKQTVYLTPAERVYKNTYTYKLITVNRE